MALAAENPTDRVEQLIILTERLTEIILREIGILRDRRPRDLKELEADKTKLARVYAQEMAMVNKQRSLIEGVKDELMLALKKATAAFREALTEHNVILSSAKRITEDMVKSIADEITAKRRPAVTYGKAATLQKGGSSRPVALTFNQVV